MQSYTVYLYLETAYMFRVVLYLHPSSGAHKTVSTASGTCQTVMDKIKLLIKCM